MNENEDYFRILKNGHIHILSDRIPLEWKQILVLPISIFLIFTAISSNLIIGIYVGLLSGIGYLFYRFASYFYHTELLIDNKNGRLTRQKKILDKIKSTELITDQLNKGKFEYLKITRSGKTKYLMIYKTHRTHHLLVLKNEADKNQIEKYINLKLTFDHLN